MKIFILLTSIFTMTLCAQEVQTLLTEAQRDYLRGDKAAAKEKFAMIQKVEPTNRVAMSYLRMIAAEEKKNGPDDAAALRGRVEKTVIEKIEFRDATVGEALEFLGKKIATAPGGGKVNIVQQLSDAEKAVKITLMLNNIPASEALNYVANLANLTVSYEKFAVVVKPKSIAQPAAAPKADGVPKIPGL
jgi:hypothetical protein